LRLGLETKPLQVFITNPTRIAIVKIAVQKLDYLIDLRMRMNTTYVQ
jgi:hypothetical protein